eukprot:403367468
MRKTAGSYFKFQNKIDTSSEYLTSYSFEMYLKFQPYNTTNSQNQTVRANYTATILDCFPYVQVNITHQKLTLSQFSGENLEYTFNVATREFETDYLLSNQWIHLAFSYNNYSTSTNMTMQQRFYVNGEIKASKRVFTPGKSSDLSLGKGICFFGNTRHNAQTGGLLQNITLNADVGYLLVSDKPRQENSFKASVFHKYPTTNDYSLLYFKLDTSEIILQDFYYNRTAQNVVMYGMPLLQDENKTGICECYGKPMNVYHMKRGRDRISSQAVILKDTDLVITSFVLDFWILIEDDLELPSTTARPMRIIFFADKFVKIGTASKELMVSIGDTNQYTNVANVFYYRKWLYIGVQLKTTRQVGIFKNGVKVSTIGQQGTIKQSNTQFNVRHEITMKLWRFRLLNQDSNNLGDSFFLNNYLQGSNSGYTDKINLPPSYVIFDFILEDTAFSTYQYQDQQLVDGSFDYTNYYGNIYKWTFSAGLFKPDSNTCGDTPVWVDGICQDNRWYPDMKNEQSTALLQTTAQVLANEMTIELWFKGRKPTIKSQSCLVSIVDPTTKADRFRIDLKFSQSSSLHNLSLGSMDLTSQQLIFANQVQQNQWYHLTWQSSNLEPIQRAILFDQVLYQSLVYQQLAQNVTAAQLNTTSSLQYKQNSGFLDVVVRAIATLTIGNTNQGDSPFLGLLREVRIWFEYKNEQNFIERFRNLEIPAATLFRQNLAFYYRLVGQESPLTVTNLGQTLNSDLILTQIPSQPSTSLNPINSPMRFTQDADLLICPFGGYLSLDSKTCGLPSKPQVNLISFVDVNRAKGVINSQAFFKQNDQKYFNISFMLFSTTPYDQKHIDYVQSEFTYKDLTQIEVDMSKVSQAFNYSVQLRITNKIYQSDFDQYFYKTFDPACPSFNFPQMNPNDFKVYIFKKINSSTTISMVNRTYCLFDSFYNKSIMIYNWSLAQNNLNNPNVTNLISLNQSGNTNLILKQNADITNDSIVKLNISLRYNNTFIQQPQLYQQMLDLIITNRSINLIFELASVNVFNGSNLIINTTKSFIINPDYSKGTIIFKAVCPSRIFNSALDYNQTCVFTQDRRAMLITSQSYLTRMKFVQYLPYQFTIQAYIDGQQSATLTEKNVTVTWVRLTPANQPCPAINMPSDMNISNKVNQTTVFPDYQLTCQNTDGTISYYQIIAIEWNMESSHVSYFYTDVWKAYVRYEWDKLHTSNQNQQENQNATAIEDTYEYTLFDQYLRQELFIDFQDSNYWLYVTNSATLRMKIDEYITLDGKFLVNRTDLASPITIRKQVVLTQISTELAINIDSNKADYKYLYTDDLILNLSRSFDPEEKSTILKVKWSCPLNQTNQAVSFCPTDGRNFLNITLEQRIQAGWQYDMNYTFNLTVYNPNTQKFNDLVKIVVQFIQPSLGNNFSACPSFDFSRTNTAMWSSGQNITQLLFTNNITSEYKISMPQINLSCSAGSQNNYAYFQIYDQSQQITPKFTNLNSIYNFPTTASQITLTNAKIKSLNSSQNYNLTCFLWYKQRNHLNLTLATHLLQIRRITPEDKLVSQFNSNLYTVLPSNQITIDANSSFDNFNIFNRNFSYIWTCPDSIKNLSYCPKYNEPSILVTTLLRNAAQMNIPGRLHRFGVQIYDNIRTSALFQTQLFIQPDSPNRDCLMIQFISQNTANLINQDFIYPLFQQTRTTTYCTDLLIRESVNITLKDNQNSPDLLIKSFIGLERNIIQIPYLSTIAQNSTYNLTYRQVFIVANDYSNQQNISQQIRMVQKPQVVQSNDFQVTGPTIINLEQQTTGLTLTVSSLNPSYNMTQMIVRWICDAQMYAQTVCNNTIGSSLNVKFSDIGYYSYKTFVEGKVFRIQAQIVNQAYQINQIVTYFVQFISLSDGTFPSTCQIQSNMIGNLNITRQIIFSLICESSQQKFLDALNVQYQWSIQNTAIEYGVINQTDKSRTLRLKPFALEQNRMYIVNLTITYPDMISKLTLFQQYNTSQSNVQPVIQTGGWVLQPSFGYFFQTNFSLLLNQIGFGTNNTNPYNGSLNLFAQIRIYDGSQWYCLIPFQLLFKNFTNFSLPVHQRIVFDIMNNLGQVVSQTFPSSYQIYNDQNAQDATLLTQIQNRLQYFRTNATNTTILNFIEPWQKLNDLFQLLQIANRLKSSNGFNQIAIIGYSRIVASNLEEIRNFTMINNETYCYVSPFCLRIKQNAILIIYQAFDLINEFDTGIDDVLIRLRDVLLYFLDSLEILTTDLNQNLADFSSIILYQIPSTVYQSNFTEQEVTKLQSEYQRVSDLIKLYHTTIVAPGEFNGGDDGNTGQNIYKLITNQNFSYSTNDLLVFIPSAVINNLTLANMPNIPLTIQIKTQSANSTNQSAISNLTFMTNIIADLQIFDSNSKAVEVKDTTEQMIVRFNTIYAINNSLPSPQLAQRSICTYQTSQNQSTQNQNLWYADGLQTQLQLIDNINRSLCYTRHLTRFTVIQNKTLEPVPDVPQIYQETEIEYFYDQHWDKYLIAIIIIVLLFLFTSALTYYHHVQMFKKPKNLEDLHQQQQIMTSENLVVLDGELRYTYRLASGLKIIQQLFMVNSTMGIILVSIKYLSLALRTQIFFGQIFTFSVIGALYFRFRTFYQFSIANGGQLVDSVVLMIIVYFLILIPLSYLTNYLYSMFKPKLFKLRIDSSQSSQQNTIEQPNFNTNTIVNLEGQQNFTSNNNQFEGTTRKLTQQDINGKRYRQHTNLSDSQAIRHLQGYAEGKSKMTFEENQKSSQPEELDQDYQYSGGESESDAENYKQSDNKYQNNKPTHHNQQVVDPNQESYISEESDVAERYSISKIQDQDLEDDSIQDGIQSKEQTLSINQNQLKLHYPDSLDSQDQYFNQLEEVKESHRDYKEGKRDVNETQISRNIRQNNADNEDQNNLKGSKMSLKSQTTKNQKYVSIAQEEENKFYTFRVAQTLGTENVISSSHRGLLKTPNTNQRVLQDSNMKLMNSLKNQKQSQKTSIKQEHLSTQPKKLMSKNSKNNINVSPQMNMQMLNLNTQEEYKASIVTHQNDNNNSINLDEINVMFDRDGPTIDPQNKNNASFMKQQLKHKSAIGKQKQEDLLKKSQLNSKMNYANPLVKSQAVLGMNQILVEGESPDKRSMSHLDLDSMDSDVEYIQDETMRSFDNQNNGKGRLLYPPNFDIRESLMVQSEKSRKQINLDDICIDVEGDDNQEDLNKNPLQVQSKSSKLKKSQNNGPQDQGFDDFENSKNVQQRQKHLQKYKQILVIMFVTNCLLLALTLYLGTLMDSFNLAAFIIFMALILVMGSIMSLVKAVVIKSQIELHVNQVRLQSSQKNKCLAKWFMKLFIGEQLLNFSQYIVKQKCLKRDVIETEINAASKATKNQKVTNHMNIQEFDSNRNRLSSLSKLEYNNLTKSQKQHKFGNNINGSTRRNLKDNFDRILKHNQHENKQVTGIKNQTPNKSSLSKHEISVDEQI